MTQLRPCLTVTFSVPCTAGLAMTRSMVQFPGLCVMYMLLLVARGKRMFQGLLVKVLLGKHIADMDRPFSHILLPCWHGRNKDTFTTTLAWGYKINVDPSFIAATRASTIGVVACDHDGHIVVAPSLVIGNCCHADAEANSSYSRWHSPCHRS